ncbi:WRKY transcription factor 19 [Spatholobus suberectus]|nr:WRKY transcription factor 19 [Spatholobus suberectus]
MDVRFQNLSFTANPSANAFKILDNSMQVEGRGSACSTDTILQLDFPASSISKGMKRKWDLIDGCMGQSVGSSLSLGLGLSTRSSDSKESSATTCTAMSSAKEIDEESSMDIELDFTLHLGCEKVESLKKPSSSNLKIFELQPKVDLELSISNWPSESNITSVCPSPSRAPPLQLNMEIPLVFSRTPNVDEGSTSCSWKPGLVSLNTGASVMLNQAAKKFDHNPIVLDYSLTRPKSSVTCTSGLTQQREPPHCNSNPKTCQVQGCGKGARGASGRCISHGGGRRCQKPSCNKGAEYLGGTKSAEGSTDFCFAHGGGQRCSHKGCIRAARGKYGLCIRHGGGKRCQRENCTKSVEDLSGLCISHGGGCRCQASGCTKGAQGSTMFCKAHGGGKCCTAPGGSKGAEGTMPFCKGHGGGNCCAYQGGGICTKSVHGGTNFCVAHGGGMKCAVPDCTKSARGRTDYCVRHGGGNRCKFEGCGKSAQGGIDFCKAHGGGKRCSWGHPESEYSNQQGGPCNSFARGKTGLCALHSGIVLDKRVHGGVSLGPVIQDTHVIKLDELKQIVINHDIDVDMMKMGSPRTDGAITCSDVELNEVESTCLPAREDGHTPMSVAVPEGRVHGGSLMAMLMGSSGLGTSSGRGLLSDPSETIKASIAPQSKI